MARRIVRARVRKRPTKWCGVVLKGSMPDSDSIVVADAVPLCPSTSSVNDEADPVVGWCKGHISISRLLGSMPTPAAAWAIVRMQSQPGTDTPVQIFNPFNQGDLERQDILGMGHLVIPPIVLDSANVQETQRGTSVTEVNIKVSRKLSRNHENIYFWTASTDEAAPGTDNALQVISTIRTLMKFG